METILAAAIEAFPALLFVALGVAITVAFFWFYSKKVKPIDVRTKGADCQLHSRDIEDTKQNVGNILSAIRALELTLTSLNPTAVNTLSQTRSPRQLTDVGKEVLHAYKGDVLLSTHIEYFIQAMEERQFDTALDAEQGAYIILLEKSSESLFNEVKSAIYSSPKQGDMDVNLGLVCFAMSLELRNAYLERHPELLPEA